MIDADQGVHDLQKKGGRLYQALFDWLGDAILQDNGELDRQALGQAIFGNQEMMAKSSALQNDIIRQELAQRRQELAKTESLFFMDIPLLIELDYVGWFDAIWLVVVDDEMQLNRLMARNHLTLAEAKKRMASQMPTKEKLAYADHILDNNGDKAALEKQVEALLTDLSQP